jgi:glucose/mannose-6-phosphate isomerase
VLVVKGYSLPAFCGGDTLVFACSFSGNTEETVAAYTEAVARGCRVVAVASGGKLASLAETDDTPFVRLTDPMRMPRAALGSLAAAPIGVLDAMGLVPGAEEEVGTTADLLDRLSEELGPDRPAQANEAKSVAGWLGERVPLVWGTEGPAEAAALRWKTQFNENAKVPAFSSTLPELGHNEVEGWSAGRGERFAVLVLRTPGEPPRVGPRLAATRGALTASGLVFRQVMGREGPPLASLFGLILLGDFASAYLGLARGVDPSPVPVLMGLKESLAGARSR